MKKEEIVSRYTSFPSPSTTGSRRNFVTSSILKQHQYTIKTKHNYESINLTIASVS